MKISDYASLAVAGLLIYGGYKLFKGISDLKNPFSGVGDSITNIFKKTVRIVENPLNVQQEPAPADSINNWVGLNWGATTERLIPSFDHTQPTTQKQLTSAPIFSGMLGGTQTIATNVNDIQQTMALVSANAPVSNTYQNPYKRGKILEPTDAGYINLNGIWGF